MVGRADREDILRLASQKRLVERAIVILHVVAERRHIVGIVLRVERGRVIEDRIAAADAGLAVLERIPGKAEAGRQVVIVGIGHHVAERVAAAVSRPACIAVIEQAGQRILENLGTDARLVRRQIESLVAVELVVEQP